MSIDNAASSPSNMTPMPALSEGDEQLLRDLFLGLLREEHKPRSLAMFLREMIDRRASVDPKNDPITQALSRMLAKVRAGKSLKSLTMATFWDSRHMLDHTIASNLVAEKAKRGDSLFFKPKLSLDKPFASILQWQMKHPGLAHGDYITSTNIGYWYLDIVANGYEISYGRIRCCALDVLGNEQIKNEGFHPFVTVTGARNDSEIGVRFCRNSRFAEFYMERMLFSQYRVRLPDEFWPMGNGAKR